jgi:methionine-S-sulfoxide reductase
MSNTNNEAKDVEVAYLAGGCFWGVAEILRKLPGVQGVEVGYMGGKTSHPTYEEVVTGQTGHAEAVKVIFDPKQVSYEEVLDYFFRLHDPTTLNQQGNDRGTQYRSAIFCLNPNQVAVAQKKIDAVNSSGKWQNRVVTEVVETGEFFRAEDYHQDYLQKNPRGYNCHWLRPSS